MAGRKRIIAVCAAVLVILLVLSAVWLGANRSLGGKVEAAKLTFYEGVPDSLGGREPGIAAELKACLDASDGLQTIAAKYSEVYDAYSALRTARNTLYGLWERGDSPAAMYEANEAFVPRFRACHAALEPLVSAKERALAAECLDALECAQQNILDSGYNAYITDFNETVLGRFPASLLKGLLTTALPEYWGKPS